MLNAKRNKALATLLTLAMAASVVPANVGSAAADTDANVFVVADEGAATGSAASGTAATVAPTPTLLPVTGPAATAEPTSGPAATTAPTDTQANLDEFQKLLKDNANAALNLADGQQILVTEKDSITDPIEIVEPLAANLAEAKGATGMKYTSGTTADGKDLFVFTLYKKTFSAYLIDEAAMTSMPGAMTELKKVKEVRNTKKAGGFVIKQIKGKKITITTYKLTAKGLKKKSSYIKKGNTYKMNKKKITKKKYNKFDKKFKKLQKTVFNSTEGLSTDFLKEKYNYYYSKDLFWWNDIGDVDGFHTHVWKHDATDSVDPYKAYAMYGDIVGRFVLAPNVASNSASGSGATFMKEQWDKMLDYNMNYRSVIADDIVAEFGGKEVKSSTVTKDIEITTPNGKTAKVTQYSFIDKTDSHEVCVNVFQDGVLKDKIERIEIGNPVFSTKIFYFTYNQYAEFDGQWIDPATEARCYADASYASVNPKTRTLTIGYAGKNPAMKEWTVKAAADVVFIFPVLSQDESVSTGFFYKNADGTTLKLPQMGVDPSADPFELALNKKDADGNYDTVAPALGNVFWAEA